MANWLVTDWQDADWSALPVYSQFRNAIVERFDNRLYECYAGMDVHSAVSTAPYSGPSTVGNFQGMTQACAGTGYWVQSHELDGSPRPRLFFEGATDFELWTWENLCKASGLWRDAGNHGFRRATTAPDDWTDINDPAFSFGLIQPGDIVGPWIWADLQAVLNHLIWQWFGPYWAHPGSDWTERSGYGTSQADAEANFLAAPTYREIGWQRPGAWKGYDGGTAWVTRFRNKMMYNFYSTVPRDIEWYTKPMNWGYPSWDGGGEVVLDKLHCWCEDLDVTDSLVYSSQWLGDLPAVPGPPPPWPSGTLEYFHWGGGAYDYPQSLVRWKFTQS